jgi:endonuclease-3
MVNKKQLAAALTNLATKESLDDKENQPLLRPQSRYPKRKMNVKNEPTDNTEPSQSKLTPLNDVSIKNEPQIKHEEVAQTSAYFSKQTNDAESDSKKAKWEPSLWKEQFARIRKMRSSHDAPVDTSGCDSLANSSAKTPQDKRFCVLVSLMLSAQTKDEVTARAVRELEKLPLNIETMIATDEEIISKAIYPVSFYKVCEKNNYNLQVIAYILKFSFHSERLNTSRKRPKC